MKKIVIKQYKPSPTAQGINVLDKEIHLTRQETIEHIAKALYKHQYEDMFPRWEDNYNCYREIYWKRAEAALNALLGA